MRDEGREVVGDRDVGERVVEHRDRGTYGRGCDVEQGFEGRAAVDEIGHRDDQVLFLLEFAEFGRYRLERLDPLAELMDGRDEQVARKRFQRFIETQEERAPPPQLFGKHVEIGCFSEKNDVDVIERGGRGTRKQGHSAERSVMESIFHDIDCAEVQFIQQLAKLHVAPIGAGIISLRYQ